MGFAIKSAFKARLFLLYPSYVLYVDATMTNTARQLLERVASWPDEDVAMLEEAAREIEALRTGEYQATDDELQAIDEAIAELDGGVVASEVRAAFAKFRDA